MKVTNLIFIILFQLFKTILFSQTLSVLPYVETKPVEHGGDAADDPAIWIHPTDPDSSFFIGTDKDSAEGHLELYNLDGTRFFSTPSCMKLNNVDLRYNFPFNDGFIDIVSASNRTDNCIQVFRIDPVKRTLVDITGNTSLGYMPYGYAMYYNPNTNKFYGYASNRYGSGNTRQYELFDNGNGGVDAALVRTLYLDTLVEGIVADDELGYVYIAEEDAGIWKYGANPDDGQERVLKDLVGGQNISSDDIEGLTIYYASDCTGYLLASSQGQSEFLIYQREEDNDFIGKFQIVNNNGIDGTSQTDGIDVLSYPLGSAFPNGVFIAHDGQNTGESTNSNFKVVPWENITNVFQNELGIELIIDTTRNPREPSEYIPLKSIENIQLDFSWNDIIISWNEVTENVISNPVIVNQYKLYFSENSYSGFAFLDSVFTPLYLHQNVVNLQKEYYYITAVSLLQQKIE